METFCLNDNIRKSSKSTRLVVKSPHAAAFQPLLQSLAAKDELNGVIKNRIEKACTLLDAGVPLYPNSFRKDVNVEQIFCQFGEYDKAALAELAEVGHSFALAGRIVSLRSFGKTAFFHLQDASDQIQRLQIYAAYDVLGSDIYAFFKKLDIGDIVGVRGILFRTKTAELTLEARSIELITKSMRPLPEKYHGLKDVETRYRRRYLDLIVSPRTRNIFRARTRIIKEFRRFMDDHGFMEVETPMMQSIPGGATARPFITYHNALDARLYLRIAPELYLKRLLVGGFEKVYELNRNFRNEGVSTQHNPEFTMAEFYWAYADFRDLMGLTERLFAHIATAVTGSSVVSYQGQELDLTPGHWHRVDFYESLEQIGGVMPALYRNYDALKKFIQEQGEKVVQGEKLAKLQAKIFDLLVEPRLIQPHFIYSYPVDISPLSRRNEANPEVTDRFELFIAGREMANAFSELNDPIDQRRRFEDQVSDKTAGDDEAHFMDEDYIRALEFGMPPAAGQGVGIDRLVMLLTDSASIREVIFFPLLRSETEG
ncbi:lysine--tRNA ligase, constitutive [Desulfovibrionales bacterium]